MVGAAGLEPATLCLEGRCSIRLSYAPKSVPLLILNHFQSFSHPCFLPPSAKLYQNCIKTPSVWPACIKTLHLLIRLAIELLQRLALHLQLHLRILLEHPSVTLPK